MEPQELATAVAAGGKAAIAPRLQAMSAHMKPYMNHTLVDVVLQHSSAQLVIMEWHNKWTRADKAASLAH